MYIFVLKETTAHPLGTPQGLSNLSKGSWQGMLSSPFKTFVGCQSEAERPGCNGNPVPREEMRTESSRPWTSGGKEVTYCVCTVAVREMA